ncbi:nose resistant to fluoxetine protein 6-like isoform X2 [Anthonomus grandis grandis]|uniref:nose resistant to fluoxetine protein 6-like isoform X2 n=1 Tax=Anthonomus grandis grandis TaxID=2921223 RepID=UPI002166A4A4|nr:nose resistant to fluoxetine protein 6-like isoform X2 [Anthonomus grandis grandis]
MCLVSFKVMLILIYSITINKEVDSLTEKSRTNEPYLLDASSKPQPGFLTGNLFHFGNYDECLAIAEDKEEYGVIEGQYCTVAVTPVSNTSSDLGQILEFTKSIPDIMGIERSRELSHIIKYVKVVYGICLPKSCKADSIQKLWNYIEYTFRLPVHISTSDDFCVYKGKTPFEFEFDNFVWWIFGIYFAFITFCSIYDMMFEDEETSEEEETMWVDLLKAFSLQRNAKKVFNIEPNPNEDTKFSCFLGFKAISMLWIVYGHRFALGYISGIINMMVYFEWRETVLALLILVNPFAVDTFLVISGVLISYKYMQLRDLLPAGKPFPYFMYYLMRFLRLWPGLIATVLFYTCVMKYLTDGPMWTIFTYKLCLSCKFTGWATALFMSNFMKFHYQCVEPTWYLAVDTQLYCISPLLLYCLYKYPRRTTFGCLIACVCSGLWTYYVTLVDKESWLPAEGDDNYYKRIYQSTFVRMPVWLIGILVGTLLYNYPNIKLSKVIVNSFWTTSATIIGGIIWVTYLMANKPYDEYSAALFNSMARHLWGIAISLIIILCSTGHGGKVNRILSSKYFKPMVRISYSVFLLHSVIILLFQGGKRSPSYHSDFQIFHGFLGDLPLVLLGAFVWCLSFESPFISIGKIIVKYYKEGYRNMKIALPEKREQNPRDESKGKLSDVKTKKIK